MQRVIIDLSQTLSDGMGVYEGDPPVRIATVRTREKDGWELRELAMGSHTGTHCDAPVHMHEGGATLDEVPLSHFCGSAFAVSAGEVPYPAGADGLIFVDAIAGAASVPAILAATPKFVAGDIDEEVERALLARGVVTYTDLVNFEALPRDGPFQFFGFPLKIEKGDGSPVRAVAVVESAASSE